MTGLTGDLPGRVALLLFDLDTSADFRSSEELNLGWQAQGRNPSCGIASFLGILSSWPLTNGLFVSYGAAWTAHFALGMISLLGTRVVSVLVTYMHHVRSI